MPGLTGSPSHKPLAARAQRAALGLAQSSWLAEAKGRSPCGGLASRGTTSRACRCFAGSWWPESARRYQSFNRHRRAEGGSESSRRPPTTAKAAAESAPILTRSRHVRLVRLGIENRLRRGER